MSWCLIIPAIICTLLALLSLILRPNALALPRPRPGMLLRGCLATLFLLLAGGLLGLASLVSQ